VNKREMEDESLWYSSADLLNQTHAEHDVPYLCSLFDNYSVDGDVTESVMSAHNTTGVNKNDQKKNSPIHRL
jgi:hypothetical protein